MNVWLSMLQLNNDRNKKVIIFHLGYLRKFKKRDCNNENIEQKNGLFNAMKCYDQLFCLTF